MKREIKFRCYWNGVNKMKYFTPGHFEDIKGAGWVMTFVQPEGEKSIFLGAAEIMQYTNLNAGDKEIYEGDKLSFTVFDYNGSDMQYEGYVVYSGSRFMILKTPESEFYGSDGGFDLDWVLQQDDTVEIIGHMFQKQTA